MQFKNMGDAEIQRELGRRLRRVRLNQNLRQRELAEESGVAVRTIANVEGGKGCSMSSLIAILRGLRKLETLGQFLPEPGIRPIELAERAGKRRQRASRRRTSRAKEEGTGWSWGDEERGRG